MPQPTQRLRLQVDQQLRSVNREILNPLFPDFNAAELEPAIALVARTRGAYLKAFFDLAKASPGSALPDEAQRKELAALRKTYEELVAGFRALELAIERDYLDVDPT